MNRKTLNKPLTTWRRRERSVRIVVIQPHALLSQKQQERVLARPGMTAEKFRNILSRQVPDEEKRARADYVIDTGCSMEETRRQVKELIGRLSNPGSD